MSESSTVSCPHCGQTYGVTAEQRAQYGGRPITCTQCQRPFTADGAPVAGATPPSLPPPVPSGGLAAGYSEGAAWQPPVGYATPGPYGAVMGQQKTSGWAVTSLVLGCLSFFIPIVCSLGAIVTGAIGLAKTGRPGVGGRGLAIAGMSLGAGGLLVSTLLISILLPSLNRAREQANRIKCGSNLRQIGMAMMTYANENKGRYPDNLETLILVGDLQADALVCPTTAHTIAPGGTPQEQAASLATPGHLSYVYLGKGLTIRERGNVILAYEPPANHRNDGMNVLYADGHVEFKGRNVALKIVSELEAGNNPPPSDRPGL